MTAAGGEACNDGGCYAGLVGGEGSDGGESRGRPVEDVDDDDVVDSGVDEREWQVYENGMAQQQQWVAGIEEDHTCVLDAAAEDDDCEVVGVEMGCNGRSSVKTRTAAAIGEVVVAMARCSGCGVTGDDENNGAATSVVDDGGAEGVMVSQ